MAEATRERAGVLRSRDVLGRIARDFPDVMRLADPVSAQEEWGEMCQLMSEIASVLNGYEPPGPPVQPERWRAFFLPLGKDYVDADDPTRHMIELCLVESLPSETESDRRAMLDLLGPELGPVYVDECIRSGYGPPAAS